MCDCLCFNGAPVDEDPRKRFQGRQWETSMMHACCNHPLGCLIAIFCPPCYACHLRRKALQYDMSRYRCCQGYICRGCTECTDGCAQDCPNLCLCLESFACESCAISATRIYVQEEREIQTDPCDNRIIRFNNFCQLLSCICHFLAIFIRDLRALAHLIDLIADIVYCLTQACMQAQTDHELTLHPTSEDYGLISNQPVAYGGPAPAQYGAANTGYAPAPGYAPPPMQGPPQQGYPQPPPQNYPPPTQQYQPPPPGYSDFPQKQ
eukprot:m.320842 g.320842  ORF g.320842 m.320842 type:complete len:264 (+) comp24605_c0_seq1:60-851(+)